MTCGLQETWLQAAEVVAQEHWQRLTMPVGFGRRWTQRASEDAGGARNAGSYILPITFSPLFPYRYRTSASFLASVQLLTADQDQPLVFRFENPVVQDAELSHCCQPGTVARALRLALQKPPAERFPAYVRSFISGSAALTVTSAIERPINHLAHVPCPW